MTFFTILLVLAVLQLWGSGQAFQNDQWFERWSNRIFKSISHKTWRLAVLIILPMLVILFLCEVLDNIAFGLFLYALYVVVLLYSLGRGDFTLTISDYLQCWRVGDFEAAYLKAQDIGDFTQSDVISSPQTLHDRIREVILYEGYQRWFAVVFWFLILGPAGALGYRLCHIALGLTVVEQEDRQRLMKVLHYLDWLPARLLSVCFALTGSFESAFNAWLTQVSDNKPLPELIDECARAALNGPACVFLSTDTQQAIEQGEAEIHAVQALLSRSVIAWLIFIALAQLVF